MSKALTLIRIVIKYLYRRIHSFARSYIKCENEHYDLGLKKKLKKKRNKKAHWHKMSGVNYISFASKVCSLRRPIYALY